MGAFSAGKGSNACPSYQEQPNFPSLATSLSYNGCFKSGGRQLTNLVVMLIGPDRPGLVQALAAVIAEHGGNWLEGRMAQLAGKFAGILRIEVAPESLRALTSALERLQADGL